jgi:SAM-dependent methyltransferase
VRAATRRRAPVSHSTAPECPVCESTCASFVTEECGYQILECGTCTLVYVHPMPVGEMARISFPDFAEPTATKLARDKLRVSSSALVQLARRHPQRGLLVDIGCGSGMFLEQAHRAGWTAIGVDVSPAAGGAGTARPGLSLVRGSAGRIPLAPASAHVVTMWNVLEHVRDPRRVMDEVARTLAPGTGTLVVRVPNMNFHKGLHHARHLARPALQRVGRRMPPFLGGIEPPEHVLGFGPTALAILLRRTGFRNIAVNAGHDRVDPWGSDDPRGGITRALSRAVSATTRSLHRASHGAIAFSPTLEAFATAPTDSDHWLVQRRT